MCVHIDSYNANLTYSSAATNQWTRQEVWPIAAQRSLMMAKGEDFTTSCDVGYIAASVAAIGIVDGATAVGIDYGKTLYFPFKQTLKFSLWTGNSEYSASNPLITDIYECVAARNMNAGDAAYLSPQEAFQQCVADGQTLSGRTVPTQDFKGMTPFNVPNFGKYWKILTVTRVSLVYNTVTHFKVHTRGVYSKRKFENNYCLKGVTKAVMFISEPTFQFALPATYNFNVSGIQNITTYKIPPKFNSGGIAATTSITLAP